MIRTKDSRNEHHGLLTQSSQSRAKSALAMVHFRRHSTSASRKLRVLHGHHSLVRLCGRKPCKVSSCHKFVRREIILRMLSSDLFQGCSCWQLGVRMDGFHLGTRCAWLLILACTVRWRSWQTEVSSGALTKKSVILVGTFLPYSRLRHLRSSILATPLDKY